MVEDNYYNRITDENYLVENEDGEMVPNYDITIVSFKEGDILKGKVVKIDKDEVLIDVGYKSEGVIPINEISIRNNARPEEVLEVDEVVEIMVLQKEDQDGRLILSRKRAEIEKSFDKVEELHKSNGTIEGEVIECVKGGLILDIGLRGFLPASLIDVRKTKELESYIGEKCTCRIIEVDRNRNNVVLSRKAIIEDERREQRKETLNKIEVGQIKNGIITSIADFGAFVDVEGIDGLIHISELSWNHVKHPSEVVKVNDEVDVEVLDIDYEKQRLSLGLKQTQKDPWIEKIKKFKKSDVVKGKVTRIVKFGLFVQIEEGMEGLVHISELSDQPVKRPSDIAKIGDELDIRIIDIDYDKRRMAFSVRQVSSPDPEETPDAQETEGQKQTSGPAENAAEDEGPEMDEARENVEEPEGKGSSSKKDPEEQKEEPGQETKELSKEEKKKAKIQELLKEMKDEANI